MISYSGLFRATNGFSSTHLIGSGAYGSVYKGFLGGDHEDTIAVKVFNSQYKGGSKSFDAECKVLKNIRHQNLLKIRTACSSIDYKGEEFKALVFDYMPNGNLDQWLHPSGSDNLPCLRRLSLLQRLNIAIDVACALDYLHSDYCQEEPIVHRDLKPRNVLLDADMVAHVGDFGLSKFLHGNAQNTTSTLGIGTVGYVAPEYGLGGTASTDKDVYSFGILLLEMLTGRRPTDERLKDQLDLHKYAENALSEKAFKIIDPALLHETRKMHETQNYNTEIQMCIFSLLEIGVYCSRSSPQERKKMKDVLVELRLIKERCTGHGIGN